MRKAPGPELPARSGWAPAIVAGARAQSGQICAHHE
jgi:hypothetical protein